MATVQEVIRRLSIESTTKGVDEATAKLKQLEAGYKGVTVEGQKSETATQSMEKRFASIQRQYDVNYRAVTALAKVERDLSTAMGQGLLSAERKNELLALAARRYLDTASAAEKAAAAETAAARASVNSAAAVNQRLGVKTDFGTAGRSQDIEAYGRELDSLRAKYNPLFAANRQYYDAVRDINEAVKVGAISEKERATAMDRAKNVYLAQSKSIREIGTAAGFSSFQVANLGYQLNDIVTGLATGQSPFMIMVQQGGQVYQILGTHPQGVGGAIKQVGSLLSGLLTPARIAIGGILAVGTAAFTAQNSFRNSQIEIENALRGVGGMAGVTVRDINMVADAASSLTKLSVSQARNAATIIASSGRIAAGDLTEAVGLAQNLAKIMGVDVAEASGVLAKAFKDPVRGAQELNDRLGAFDAATLRIIQNLRDQGRIQEANLVLTRAAAEATKGAADNTSGWSKAWNVVTNSISNGWNALGQFIDKMAGFEEAQTRLEQLRNSVRSLEDQNFLGFNNSSIAKAREEIAKLEEQIKRTADQAIRAKQNLESIQIRAAVDQTLPELNQRQALENRRALLENAIIGDPVILERLGVSIQQVGDAFAKTARDIDTFATAHQKAVNSMKIQIDAVNARSPSQLADIARRQTEEQLRGANVTQAEAQERIRLAGVLAYTQAVKALNDAQRDRMISAQLSVGAAEIEIAAVGKTAREADLLRMNWQTYADLRREAERNNTKFDEAEYERLKKVNEEIARKRELLAQTQLRNDLSFERDQLGRSEVDATVASRLRSAGLPIDLKSAEADLIRMNEQLKLSKELANDFALDFGRTFRQELASGANAWEAFQKAGLNALQHLSDKLMDMAISNLVSKAFGGSGFNIFSMFGGSASAGVASTGFDAWSGLRMERGGIFSHGNVVPFANGAAFSNAIVTKPTLFPFANGTGLMGEAGPEAIVPLKRGADGKLGVQSSGSTQGGNTYVTENHFHGPITADMKAFVLSQIKASEGRARKGSVQDIQKYHQQTFGSMSK